MSKVFSNTAFFKYVYTVFFFVKALVLPFKSVSSSEHSEENSYGFKHVKVIKHQSVVLVCYMAVASANCHISQKFRSWSCSPLLLSVQFLCKPVSFVSVLWQRKQLLQQEWSEPNRQLHQESHPYGAPRKHHGPVRGSAITMISAGIEPIAAKAVVDTMLIMTLEFCVFTKFLMVSGNYQRKSFVLQIFITLHVQC